jgi:hypothetical protein
LTWDQKIAVFLHDEFGTNDSNLWNFEIDNSAHNWEGVEHKYWLTKAHKTVLFIKPLISQR